MASLGKGSRGQQLLRAGSEENLIFLDYNIQYDFPIATQTWCLCLALVYRESPGRGPL